MLPGSWRRISPRTDPSVRRVFNLSVKHILCIGAHPDDCDFSIGGTAALFARRGDRVKFVSVTNGDRGHFAEIYARDRAALAARRMAEAARAVQVFGGEFECLGVPDGEVYVTPELTERMVRLIRSYGTPGQGPDLVLFNRPNDYHRDHRYSSQLVLDAAYLLTVPLMCPDAPHLSRMPLFMYWYDAFREGGEFRPDVRVAIDSVMDVKLEVALCHESQLFEWLPFNAGTLEQVPDDAEGRRGWVRDRLERRASAVRARCDVSQFTSSTAHELHSEALQLCEYGRQPEGEELKTLFSFPG